MFKGHENYSDWYGSRIPEIYYPKCEICGEPFQPNSPRQKICSHEDSPSCHYYKWSNKLSRDGFIKLVLGLTVKNFILQYGIDSYNSL